MSKILRPAWAFALAALLVVTGFAQQQPASVSPGSGWEELPEEDKAEIVRLTLERALIAKEIPDYNVIAKQDIFYLSAENVPPALAPKLEGVTLVLSKPEEIKEIANGRGDYVYYFKFKEFKVDGAKVIVSLDNVPMYADKPSRLAFGGGFVIEYVKRDGRWVGKEVSNWIA